MSWRERQQRAGKCLSCGGSVGEGRLGRQQCVPCQHRHAEAAKARRADARPVHPRRISRATCAAPDCARPFPPTTKAQTYCSPACYWRSRSQRRTTTGRRVADVMQPRDPAIEARIDAAYRRIQWERRQGLRPGIDPWQRRIDPLSSSAPDASDLWFGRSRSPKAPRTGRSA